MTDLGGSAGGFRSSDCEGAEFVAPAERCGASFLSLDLLCGRRRREALRRGRTASVLHSAERKETRRETALQRWRPARRPRSTFPPSGHRTSHASSPAVRTRISRPSKTSRQPARALDVATCAAQAGLPRTLSSVRALPAGWARGKEEVRGAAAGASAPRRAPRLVHEESELPAVIAEALEELLAPAADCHGLAWRRDGSVASGSADEAWVSAGEHCCAIDHIRAGSRAERHLNSVT